LRKALAITLLCLVPAIAACGDSDEKKAKKPEQQAPASAAQQGSKAGCKRVAEPKPKGEGGEKKPKGALDASRKWSLRLDTNCGSFTIGLDVKGAPNTSASLVALAKSHFFDGTTFHRIVPGFVIQGGDPTGTGQGGPGYSTVDKPRAGASYGRGVVAMAKTEQEPPGTAGSQFFVVTGQDAGLPPDYAVVGRVTDGLDTVERIAALGDPAAGPEGTPTQPVVIQKVTVTGG
jgi:cyclophilin family peptidyl-prolyl cis-trans isomerase